MEDFEREWEGPRKPQEHRYHRVCASCRTPPEPRPCQRCGGVKPRGKGFLYCAPCKEIITEEWWAAYAEKVKGRETEEDRARFRERRREQRRLSGYSANRRARERGAFLERVDRSVVFERDAGICYLCDEAVDPEDWDMDHVIPLARGGPHCYVNVAVTHPLCNRRKGVKSYH